MNLALPLVGLIIPFFCWAIEVLLPYPYIIEELGKAIFIFFAWKFPLKLTKIKLTILMAVFFSFSEGVFYLFRFSFSGSLLFFSLRLLLTTLLHTTTSLVILLPTLKSKKLILISLPLAMIIHYLYNDFASLINPF